MSVLDDRKPVTAGAYLLEVRQALELLLFIVALALVLLSLLGMLLWPAWSDRERLRRRAIVDVLTGEGAGR
jgi:hypothetical protein